MEKKTLAAPFDGLFIGSEPEVISNPYSGESVLLDPLAVAVNDTSRALKLSRIIQESAKAWSGFENITQPSIWFYLTERIGG